MCRLQLRAGGTSRWTVAEGKKEGGRDKPGGRVVEISRRPVDGRIREKRDTGGSNPDGVASSAAVTKTTALQRLVVGVLIVVGLA